MGNQPWPEFQNRIREWSTGLIPMSVKSVICDLHYKPMSLAKISTSN